MKLKELRFPAPDLGRGGLDKRYSSQEVLKLLSPAPDLSRGGLDERCSSLEALRAEGARESQSSQSRSTPDSKGTM